MPESGGPAISLEEAARLGGAGGQHLPRPRPLARAILWRPAETGAEDAAAADPALAGVEPGESIFIEQAVLRRINAHLAEARLEEHFGFLLGSRFRCPDTGRDYSLIDLSLAARDPLVEEKQGACLLRAWVAAQEAFLRHDRRLLGWYHSHSLLGLFLSEADTATTARYFGQPGQCAVVAVPDQVRPLGGVFQIDATGARGGECVPFFELLDGTDGDGGAPRVSAVEWRNYVTDEDVRREVFVNGEKRRGGVEEAVGAVPAAGHVPTPVMLPGESAERVLPLPRGHTWGVLGWGLTVVLVIIGAWRILEYSGRRVNPISSGDRPAVPSVPVRAGFSEAAVALRQEIDRYRERKEDFDRGRIDCALLVSGYRAADEAFVKLAQVFSAVTAASDSVASAEYERLSTEMDDVNRHFDGSGCTRPQ